MIINLTAYIEIAAQHVIREASWDRKFCDVVDELYGKKTINMRKRILEKCEEIFIRGRK